MLSGVATCKWLWEELHFRALQCVVQVFVTHRKVASFRQP